MVPFNAGIIILMLMTSTSWAGQGSDNSHKRTVFSPGQQEKTKRAPFEVVCSGIVKMGDDWTPISDKQPLSSDDRGLLVLSKDYFINDEYELKMNFTPGLSDFWQPLEGNLEVILKFKDSKNSVIIGDYSKGEGTAKINASFVRELDEKQETKVRRDDFNLQCSVKLSS